MGIFERRAEDEGKEVEAPATASSPQGWFDRSVDWPVDASTRYTHLFESPMAAVFHLEDAGRRLSELEARLRLPGAAGESDQDRHERLRALEAYFLSLQALALEPLSMGERKGSYGRLAHDLRGHLHLVPEIVHYRSARRVLESILHSIAECGDPQLTAEGNLTRQELARALETMPEPPPHLAAASIPPAPPPRPAPAPGPAPAAPVAAAGAEAAEAEAEGPADGEGGGAGAAPGTPHHGGSDLTAEKIFRVLLEECLKDGKISQAESRAIRQIRQVLQIPVERHRLLAESVQEDYLAGRVRGGEDMDPLTFFEKICRIALLDGRVTGSEQRLLQAMASYLHVTKEEFGAIRQRIHENPGL